MAIYSDEIATSTGVATTFTALTKYSPLTGGRLIQVKLNVCGDAVTSLIENVTIKLECPLWGVPLMVTVAGANIRTAPAFPIPIGVQNCDLPVATGTQITPSYKHETGATPVTPRIQVIGVFEG